MGPTRNPDLGPGPRKPPPPTARLIQNLREHPRFKAEGVGARMYLKGFLTGIGLGRTNVIKGVLDLSEGGLRISARQQLAEGARVRFSLTVERFNDVIKGDGEIRWCRQSAHTRDLFYVGVRFKPLPPADRKKIAGLREWLNSPAHRAAARQGKDRPPMEIST